MFHSSDLVKDLNYAYFIHTCLIIFLNYELKKWIRYKHNIQYKHTFINNIC